MAYWVTRRTSILALASDIGQLLQWDGRRLWSQSARLEDVLADYRVPHARDLGVWFSINLSPSARVISIVAKAHQLE